AALSARLFRRRRAQEARSHAPIREDRRRAHLLPRCRKIPQGKIQVGGCRPPSRHARDEWQDVGAASWWLTGERSFVAPSIPANPPSTGSNRALTTPLPRSGTILVREWQGRAHHVTVVDAGFLWNGRSLH